MQKFANNSPDPADSVLNCQLQKADVFIVLEIYCGLVIVFIIHFLNQVNILPVFSGCMSILLK